MADGKQCYQSARRNTAHVVSSSLFDFLECDGNGSGQRRVLITSGRNG